MLSSSRSTQLPGAQVALLLLCRGLCVRGQHTKTHFLRSSFPDRPVPPAAGSIPEATTGTLVCLGARYLGAEAVQGALGAAQLVKAAAGISSPF